MLEKMYENHNENFFPGTLLDGRELKLMTKLPLNARFRFLPLGGWELMGEFALTPPKLPFSFSLAASPSHSFACAKV